MKYANINKRFTEIVAEYIGKGYTINTSTIYGSQGEIAKIDLTDGKEIIRIMIKTFHDWDVDLEGVEIIIGKNTDNVKPNRNDTWDTVWNDHLEIIHQERFYKIGRHGDYYGTKEEAERASNIRTERCIDRYSSKEEYEPSAKAMEIAKRIVRNKLGYKRIIDSEVKLIKNSEGFFVVSYKTKSYHLR